MLLLRYGVLVLLGGAGLASFGCGGKSEADGPGAGGSRAGSGGVTGGSAGKASTGGAGAGTGGSRAGAAGTGASAGSGGGGGSGGDAGAGSGSGGSQAGAGANAGDAGSAGADAAGGANGGDAGESGAAGGAGAPSPGVECERAEDCYLHTDCCTCDAASVENPLPVCQKVCGETACYGTDITPEDVQCSFGRCLLPRSCDLSEITCPAKPVECPEAGQLPTVVDGCYGPCIPATECNGVASCDACPKGTTCMTFNGGFPVYNCFEAVASCETEDLCACFGICGYGECVETDGVVQCFCPNC